MAKVNAYLESCEKFKNGEMDDEPEFDESEIAEFAMKMMHKPTLRRERAIRYNEVGEMQMINNLDKVYSEIEIWT